MKYLSLIVFMLLLFTACQDQDGEMPTDIVGLKALEKEKNKQLRSLETELADIKAKIGKLDPSTLEKTKKLVNTLGLSKENFKRYVEVQGAVQADEMAILSSETGGRITAVYVKEGQYISKGQLGAKVDLSVMSKQKDEIITQLTLAEDVFTRQSRLWDQKIGTEIQFLQARTNVDNLKKSIATLEHQMKKAQVYTPISGIVDVVSKEAGELVGPGEPIATMINSNKLKVQINVPENLISAVGRGDLVEIEIPAANYIGKHKITRLASSLNPANRTLGVEVAIGSNKGAIKPNLLATMKIVDFEVDSVITIPTNLLQQEISGKYFVFIAEKKNKDQVAVKKIVVPGESAAERIIIKSGLNVNDVLVNLGSRSLAEGEYLDIKNN